ncbi:MAG TPA: TonB-dependent receptor [Bacteroidales bacterium]|nr:TonB-dependent receptor [Bacteroidales bacterium]HPO64983.1 TonB-dependent receptor [Bacteroidales bacterium]
MRYFYLFLLWAFSTDLVVGASDTDSIINIDAVEVARHRFEVLSVGATVQPVDTFLLKVSRSLSLPDLLVFSGLNVNNYGPGGLSTIAVRGMSASHTAVVWDEVNLQSPMNGQFNLSVVPACFLDKASIQYGGSGVNYGSGSMTGIVHMGTANLFQQPNQLWFSPAIGSFGNKSMGAGYKWGNHWIATSLKTFLQQADNDFPFKNTTDFYQRTVRQTNAGLKQYGVFPQFAIRTSERSMLKASCWIQQYNKDIQTMMTSSSPNLSHQNDHNVWLNVQWKYVDSAYILSVRNAYLYNQVLYFDPSQGTTDNHSRSYITELESRIWVRKNHWLQVGINYTIDNAFSQGYNENPTRSRASMFMQYKIENIASRLNLALGARQEYVSYFTPLVYSAGIEYRVTQRWRVTANLSKNYRIPTLNDLYWKEDAFAKGNPSLKPEWGWSGEWGVHQMWNIGGLQLEASQMFFYNKIYNWIMWQPDTVGKWQPINKSQGKSQGVDLRFKSQYQTSRIRSTTAFSYQYTYARTLQSNGQWGNLPPDYMPIHKASLSQMFTYKNLAVGYIHNYTGLRYTLGSRLPAYQVADLFGQYTLYKNQFKLSLQFRINNLWNQFYQVRQYYAMPMRNYLFTLMLDFSAKP